MYDKEYQKRLKLEMREFRSQVEKESSEHEISNKGDLPSVNGVYYTKSAAARLLGISYRTIERWYLTGYINRIVIGGRIYFHRQELVRVSKLYNYGIAILAATATDNTLQRLRQRHEEIPTATVR